MQMHRSSPELRCGVAQVRDTKSRWICGPCSKVGSACGWNRLAEKYLTAQGGDCLISREAAGASEKGAGRGDALPLAEGAQITRSPAAGSVAR